MVSGTRDELIKRLEAASVATTLQRKFELALEMRDDCYRVAGLRAQRYYNLHENDAVYDRLTISLAIMMKRGFQDKYVRLEKCLDECRTNLWRQTVAMGGITRLSQRDGMPPSPLAQLDTLAMDMVLKFVKAPYLEPMQK